MDWNERFQEGKKLWLEDHKMVEATEIFNEVAEATMDPTAIELVISGETVMAGFSNNGVMSGLPIQTECKKSAENALRWIAIAEKDPSIMKQSGEKILDNKKVCTYLKGKMMYLLGDDQCEGTLKDAVDLGHNQARLFLGIFYKDKAEQLTSLSDESLIDQITNYYKQMTNFFEQFVKYYNPEEADQDELVLASGIIALAYRDGIGAEKNAQKAEYYQAIADSFDPETKTSNPEKYLAQNKTNSTSNNNNTTSSGGCYVATAVYGSYDCPEVWTLRRYRDYRLAETWYGRFFIHTYYAISPAIVKLFGETVWFKTIWRRKLDHMVEDLKEKGFKDTPYNDRVW